MFTPTDEIENWQDLQEKVCQLFKEMDYQAEVSKTVELAGRGKKEIDVYVEDPLASHNQVYLIECKNWNHNVPQEVVHSFKFVMESAGASTGFIISKKGFQSGAHEAARFTNIQLLTFEELQHLYGDEWFRKNQEKLKSLLDKLRQIYHLHFEQGNIATIHNNMFFNTPELYQELCRFNVWVGDLMGIIMGKNPENYLGPEPVKLASNPMKPDSRSHDWYTIKNVRDYFNITYNAAQKCIDEFELMQAASREKFDALKSFEQDELFSRSLKMMREEMPLRVLKDKLGNEEYERILRAIV